MISWPHITLITLVILLLLLLLILQRFLHPKTRFLTLPLQNVNHHTDRVSQEPYHFSWADHPSLIADAVENGWPRFHFTSDRQDQVESSWEGSISDDNNYLQKIRVKMNPNSSTAVIIRADLPLPGPRFGNSYFPHESYFEITFNADYNIDWNKSIFSVGLIGGIDHLPLEIPGSFPGSIGFNSTGSVSLNGRKLVLESERNIWGRAESHVIGCGYNPVQKKLFFTVDSQLLHLIHCKTLEFGHPLYPTIATDQDILVLINLGQNPFRFEPGNSQRTPNPCLAGSHQDHPPIGFEHSKELFSIHEWRLWNDHPKAIEVDQESDLFEIHLNSSNDIRFDLLALDG